MRDYICYCGRIYASERGSDRCPYCSRETPPTLADVVANVLLVVAALLLVFVVFSLALEWLA